MPHKVVMMCVDCLRGDFLDLDAETPFLRDFFEDSKSFSSLYSTATTTTPCVASMMTGVYSEQNGVMSLRQSKLDDDRETLAETLSDEGYETKALVTGPLYPETGLDRGFDDYSMRDASRDLFGGLEEDLHRELDDLDEKSFAYVHLWELHGPINVPGKFDSKRYGETDYERALSALDRRLEAVVDRLGEDVCVILTGDHGESIAYRSGFIQQNIKRLRTLLRYYGGIDTRPVERALNRLADRFSEVDYPHHFMEAGHGENVFDFASNVPLAISSVDTDEDNVEAQVRQIDIFPTVLELCDTEPDKVRGKSLLGEVDDRTAYIRACGESLKSEDNWARAVRDNGWKLVVHPNRNWNQALYKPRDNQKELSSVRDERRADELKQAMPRFESAPAEELEIKEKLRGLGYG